MRLKMIQKGIVNKPQAEFTHRKKTNLMCAFACACLCRKIRQQSVQMRSPDPRAAGKCSLKIPHRICSLYGM